MKKLKIVIPVLIIGLFIAWYAFRPERLFINHQIKEQFPSAQSETAKELAFGKFHSVLHETKGSAAIYELSDGTRVLRLSNFATSNGPDVHIYMVASDDALDNASVLHSNFIDLGAMKANIGDQNYSLSRDMDLSKYRTVSVWCKRFSVNFGAAPLKHSQS